MGEEETASTRRSFLRYTTISAPVLLGGIAGCQSMLDGEPPRDDSESTPTRTVAQDRETPGASPTGNGTTGPDDEPATNTPTGEYPGFGSLPDPLAVDATNPFVFTNDHSTDNYMGELALGMADSGTVDLKGFLLGYPREVWRNKEKARRIRQKWMIHHRKMHLKALESGMDDLPPPQFGVFDHHSKPASGRIEDTEPIGSVGTDRIVEIARSATPDNPAVVAVGGDICTVADAYLTDPSIADSMVVYWHEQVKDINDQSGYNVQNSGWSAYVALKRLAVVLDTNSGGFTITRAEVEERIPSPLDQYMMTKEHFKWGNPLRSTDWSEKGEHEAGDEKALLLAAFPYTRKASEPVTVSGLQMADWDYEGGRVLPTLSAGTEDSRLIEIPEIGETGRAFWSAWES